MKNILHNTVLNQNTIYDVGMCLICSYFDVLYHKSSFVLFCGSPSNYIPQIIMFCVIL